MTAPSYVGQEFVGVCNECGKKANVPVKDYYVEDNPLGWCSRCERSTTRTFWDGDLPVVVVE